MGGNEQRIQKRKTRPLRSHVSYLVILCGVETPFSSPRLVLPWKSDNYCSHLIHRPERKLPPQQDIEQLLRLILKRRREKTLKMSVLQKSITHYCYLHLYSSKIENQRRVPGLEQRDLSPIWTVAPAAGAERID